MAEPRKIFVSYAREDEAWLDRILEIFEKTTDPRRIAVWTDKELRGGDIWGQEIREALETSDAALLIVSKDFRQSKFIANVELQHLLKLYENNMFRLTWIRIDDVDYAMAFFNYFNAIAGPDPPLKDFSENEQQEILEEAVEEIKRLVQGERPPTTNETKTSRKGLVALAAVGIALVALWVSTWTSTWRPDLADVQTLLMRSNWIGYDPKNYVPFENGNVTESEIERELRQLSAEGFTGVVTYGARPDLARITRIANRMGFQVIMGIWNPNDQAELRTAYEHREFVQAYCVGHNCLSDDSGQTLCTEDQLERIISRFRALTKRPVATSQLAKCYQPTSLKLNRMGDFFFPDIHHNFRYQDVESDVEITTQTIRRISAIAEQFRLPIMLKSFCYPTRYSSDAPLDLEKQQRYLTSVLANVRDEQTGSSKPIAFALGTAYDAPWKRGSTFRDWDPFTGLCSSSGEPNPAVHEWMLKKGVNH